MRVFSSFFKESNFLPNFQFSRFAPMKHGCLRRNNLYATPWNTGVHENKLLLGNGRNTKFYMIHQSLIRTLEQIFFWGKRCSLVQQNQFLNDMPVFQWYTEDIFVMEHRCPDGSKPVKLILMLHEIVGVMDMKNTFKSKCICSLELIFSQHICLKFTLT